VAPASVRSPYGAEAGATPTCAAHSPSLITLQICSTTCGQCSDEREFGWWGSVRLEPDRPLTNMQRGNFHALCMDGLIQELNSNVRGYYLLDFGDGFTTECTYAQRYHEANGETQYDMSQCECSCHAARSLSET
jgi:hypothetical protein